MEERRVVVVSRGRVVNVSEDQCVILQSGVGIELLLKRSALIYLALKSPLPFLATIVLQCWRGRVRCDLEDFINVDECV